MASRAREDVLGTLMRDLGEHELAPVPVSDLIPVATGHDLRLGLDLLVAAATIREALASFRIELTVAVPYQEAFGDGVRWDSCWRFSAR